jgi:hypothetical protein
VAVDASFLITSHVDPVPQNSLFQQSLAGSFSSEASVVDLLDPLILKTQYRKIRDKWELGTEKKLVTLRIVYRYKRKNLPDINHVSIFHQLLPPAAKTRILGFYELFIDSQGQRKKRKSYSTQSSV